MLDRSATEKAGVAARRATAAQVADAAGVSKATVSYAFSDTKQHKITPETRQRVLAIAAEMGFRPNPTAQALASGSSKVVLALLPDWDMGPSWAVILQQLGDLLADHGFALTAVSVAHAEAVPLWRQLLPAAVLALGDLSPATATDITDDGVALVDVDLRGMLRAGGHLGAEVLHAAGHTRIGYLLPPNVPREIEQYRFEGIEAFCRDHGLPDPKRRVLDYSDGNFERLRAAWLEHEEPVTGVVAHTDELGVFLHLALRQAGIAPGTIGIIGVGDRPLAKLGLTTLVGDPSATVRHLSEGALALLEHRPADPLPPISESLTVIYRESLAFRG